LLAEMPASALRLAASLSHHRWPLVIDPVPEGVQLRSLLGWGFLEVTCPEGWARETVLLPGAPVRTLLGRHSDAELVAVAEGPVGLLVRTLSADTAVAAVIAREHCDGYGMPPARAIGGGPVTVSATFLGRILAQLRVLTDEVVLELPESPDQAVILRFSADGMTGSALLCPIFRKEGNQSA
jgi:hypothetical protein